MKELSNTNTKRSNDIQLAEALKANNKELVKMYLQHSNKFALKVLINTL